MIPEAYRRYEQTVTVSVVNFHSVWGDKAANLAKIKAMATEAAQAGTDIIAFPELALSGYECGEESRHLNQQCAMHRAAAETIPGPSTLELARLARELDLYILVGMPEEGEIKPQVHNSVAVVGPEGVLGKYRKITLSPFPIWCERACFHRGNELPVFETRFGPIGVQICADFWTMPELSRILRLKGARLILNCSASAVGPGRIDSMTYQTASRGKENEVYAASANLVGTEQTMSFYGHSTIAGPSHPGFVQVFAQGGDSEEIVTATLSFERLHYLWHLIDLEQIHETELIAEEFAKLRKNAKAGIPD
ncbi:MAG: carbon-nitrogen hydrolase family protein [Chloroflexi bacterium]|nr:carbon-nitrogen hydrolase family protein [Chloroflexota bacterium]